MKFGKIKGANLLSIGVAVGSAVLAIAKLKVESNAKEAEKAEIVKEVMEQINSKKD